MGLEEQWKVFSDLILVLRRNGVEIPSQVMKDLHSAKIMISLLGTKGSDESEILPRVESYLSSVEGFLRARRTPEKEAEDQAEKGKFIAGLRRGEGWVRIEEYDTSLSDEIEAIARQEGLQVSSEPSGHILIRGDSESIRQAIKRIREKARRG